MSPYGWFVVQTPSGREPVGERELRKIGFRTFYPHFCEWIEDKRRGHAGKSRLVNAAYFRSYLFVECREGGPALHLVNDEYKRRLVCSTDSSGYPVPLPIPIDEMERLFRITDHSGQIHDQRKKKTRHFLVGNRVRFTEQNPLFGFFAEIEEVLEDGKRLRVRLEAQMLGRQSIIAEARQLKRA